MAQSEQELISEFIRERDENSFCAIYHFYSKELYNFVRKWLDLPQDAEDVLQAAFVAAYFKVGSLRDEAHFKTWLFAIAKNEAFKKLAQANRFKNYSEAEMEHRLFGEGESNDDLDLEIGSTPDKIAALKREERTLLYMKYVEEYKISEISQKLNLSDSNVKIKLFRIRKKLTENQDEHQRSL